ERQRLAAAAAPVDLAPLAGAAGLAHPFGAAEGAEGRAVAPDLAERMLPHVPEFEPRDRLRRVAGQRLAGRRDVDREPAPAARAGFWIAGVIIGHDHVDDEPAFEFQPRLLDQRDRRLRLLARRHQRGAVRERPAIVLRVGDFEPARAELERKIDEGTDLMQVRAADDRVEGERQAGLGHHRGEGALSFPGAVIMAEPVVGLLVRSLERKLRVIEAGLDQVAHELLAHPDARGDEVGVETGRRSVPSQADSGGGVSTAGGASTDGDGADKASGGGSAGWDLLEASGGFGASGEGGGASSGAGSKSTITSCGGSGGGFRARYGRVAIASVQRDDGRNHRWAKPEGIDRRRLERPPAERRVGHRCEAGSIGALRPLDTMAMRVSPFAARSSITETTSP